MRDMGHQAMTRRRSASVQPRPPAVSSATSMRRAAAQAKSAPYSPARTGSRFVPQRSRNRRSGRRRVAGGCRPRRDAADARAWSGRCARHSDGSRRPRWWWSLCRPAGARPWPEGPGQPLPEPVIPNAGRDGEIGAPGPARRAPRCPRCRPRADRPRPGRTSVPGCGQVPAAHDEVDVHVAHGAERRIIPVRVILDERRGVPTSPTRAAANPHHQALHHGQAVKIAASPVARGRVSVTPPSGAAWPEQSIQDDFRARLICGLRHAGHQRRTRLGRPEQHDAQPRPHDLHRAVAKLPAFQREGRKARELAQAQGSRLGQPLQPSPGGDERRHVFQLGERGARSNAGGPAMAARAGARSTPRRPRSTACSAMVRVRLRVAAKAISCPPLPPARARHPQASSGRPASGQRAYPARHGPPAQDFGAFARLRAEQDRRPVKRNRRGQLLGHRQGGPRRSPARGKAARPHGLRMRGAHPEQDKAGVPPQRLATASAAGCWHRGSPEHRRSGGPSRLRWQSGLGALSWRPAERGVHGNEVRRIAQPLTPPLVRPDTMARCMASR